MAVSGYGTVHRFIYYTTGTPISRFYAADYFY